jgi:transcriptional regulator with XRE-family HTH domain
MSIDHTEIRHEPSMFATAPRQKPDGQNDPAGEVGWFLQREREKRELSLEEAGEATGIHPYHIEAIEYGDMTHMPQRMEALEMIAGYASIWVLMLSLWLNICSLSCHHRRSRAKNFILQVRRFCRAPKFWRLAKTCPSCRSSIFV